MPQLKINLDNPDNTIVQNFIIRDEQATKVPGSNRYNITPITNKILAIHRAYCLKADKTFSKKTFAYDGGGNMLLGNDSTGTLTIVKDNLHAICKPEFLTVQVADNSRSYMFNGYDTPLYYEGNDAGVWNTSSITYKFVQGVIKDGRLFGFERNSSILAFSRSLYPEDFSSTYGGEIVVGNDKDSFIRRIELLGNDIYIFKNNSVYVLRGNTKATYSVDVVLPYMGLIAQKAACFVGPVIWFVCQQDKEIYEFTGTAVPRMLSRNINDNTFSEMIDPTKTDDMVCIWDSINKLFRLSYNQIETEEAYQNHEVICPTDEIFQNMQPKWSETYGARISCYSLWDRQGDHTLVTGRADTGVIMYHNRGHNWDDEPMECIVRTDDVVPQDGYNCDFNSVYINGTPSNGTVTVRTYLDSRHSGRTSDDLADTGEQDTLGDIYLSTQDRFHNTIPIATSYDHGESLAVEIYDATKDKDIEIENIIIDYNVAEPVTGNLVG